MLLGLPDLLELLIADGACQLVFVCRWSFLVIMDVLNVCGDVVAVQKPLSADFTL